jgi:dihydropteroate synthase
MLTFKDLAALADEFRDELDAEVTPIVVGEQILATNTRPAIMGTLNLSRDSTYRESIATSTSDAIRKATLMAAQGADVVDIGAESSTAAAARATADMQRAALVPVITEVVAAGVAVSVETYQPSVVEACLNAGARMLNLTGIEHDAEILSLAAQAGATVVLCYVGGSNVRDIANVTLDADPFPALLDFFRRRVDHARDAGVEHIVLDPGMGFFYGNLTDPMTRVQHQTKVIVQSFRLRALGLPVCQALPHAFDVFGEEYRSAEAFFAVLAQLAGVSLLRTHEVAQVRAVREAMQILDAQ